MNTNRHEYLLEPRQSRNNTEELLVKHLVAILATIFTKWEKWLIKYSE